MNHAFCGIADPVSSLSHLIGAMICGWLSMATLKRERIAPDAKPFVIAFYWAAAFQLLVSGIYHSLERGTFARYFFQRVDHAAIFILIAMTFSAVQAIEFRGRARDLPLAAMWILTAACILLKTIFFTRISPFSGVVIYLAFSALASMSLVIICFSRGFHYARYLTLGTALYLMGALSEMYRWPQFVPGVLGHHELFHFFVLSALSCHWNFITCVATGETKPAPLGTLEINTEVRVTV